MTPLDWGNVVESLLPPKPRWPRRGGKQAWTARWEQMVCAAMELFKAGLLAELPDGPADMTVITDAGREAMESMPSGFIATDVELSPKEAAALRQKWQAEASTVPTSAFWVDLNRHLHDPKFRRSCVKESLRIQAFDDRMNASLGDGAQTSAQPPSDPGRPSAPFMPS
jgi:hypothetical protein